MGLKIMAYPVQEIDPPCEFIMQLPDKAEILNFGLDSVGTLNLQAIVDIEETKVSYHFYAIANGQALPTDVSLDYINSICMGYGLHLFEVITSGE